MSSLPKTPGVFLAFLPARCGQKDSWWSSVQHPAGEGFGQGMGSTISGSLASTDVQLKTVCLPPPNPMSTGLLNRRNDRLTGMSLKVEGEEGDPWVYMLQRGMGMPGSKGFLQTPCAGRKALFCVSLHGMIKLPSTHFYWLWPTLPICHSCTTAWV